MFRSKNNPPYPNQMNPGHGFYENNQMQRLIYQLEETNRKLRNLNNRLRRIENFLGLRNDDKFEDDLYYEE